MKILDNNSGLIARETAGLTLTNTASETTLFECLVRGGSLGTIRTLRYSIVCALTTTALVLPTLTIKVKFGTGEITVFSSTGLAASVANKPFKIEGEIQNRYDGMSGNSQYIYAQINYFSNILPVLSNTGASLDGADWNLNLANDQMFQITAKFNGITSVLANATLARKSAAIEIK